MTPVDPLTTVEIAGNFCWENRDCNPNGEGFRARLAALLRRVRDAALEEAARGCDQEIATQSLCLQESASRSAGACARRIRGLKGKP